jgi:hypothetical protein
MQGSKHNTNQVTQINSRFKYAIASSKSFIFSPTAFSVLRARRSLQSFRLKCACPDGPVDADTTGWESREVRQAH